MQRETFIAPCCWGIPGWSRSGRWPYCDCCENGSSVVPWLKSRYFVLTVWFSYSTFTVAVRGFRPLWLTGCLSLMKGRCQDSRGRLALKRTPQMMPPEVWGVRYDPSDRWRQWVCLAYQLNWSARSCLWWPGSEESSQVLRRGRRTLC